MRLKRLDVAGFRGFADKQSFDLSADAIIIVGSNGLGKTSLLDAVHWGMCGKVSRLDGGDKKLVSMYSPTGQARVTLTLHDGDREFAITRVYDGESQSVQAQIGEKHYQETSAKARILELLWPDAASAKDGDESLSAAVTRSVYLQQDRVREFLEGATDQERFNAISELVGAGRLTELQTQLESESRSWSRATTRLNSELAPLAESVDRLKAQLESLQKSAEIGAEINQTDWNDWWENCHKSGVEINDIPTPTSSDAASSLDKALRNIRANRDSGQRRRRSLEVSLEVISQPPMKPEDSIGELENILADATKKVTEASTSLKSAQEQAASMRKEQVELQEAREQERALAQLALELLDDRCPVCQQSYDIEATRTRLQNIIESAEGQNVVPENSESVAKLAEAEKEAIAIETSARATLASVKRQQLQYDQWERDSKAKLAELAIELDENTPKVLRQQLLDCDTQDQRLKTLAADGESLSLNIAREVAKARLHATEADLKKAETELAAHRLETLRREKTSVTTKVLIDQLRGARSKFAVDKLSEIEPLLQRIFSRIDPHPTFRVVKFATDIVRGKGRLDAEIRDNAEDKTSNSPEAILSSSQLNALAVSIFLSFNLALPHLPLQAAVLDDPIQSLDDINLLGLVDLLRRTKEKRQVIVSTHDGRFGRLLARKLRPSSPEETTSVIELRGWNRTGPNVSQYSVEADTIPIRLAAVS